MADKAPEVSAAEDAPTTTPEAGDLRSQLGAIEVEVEEFEAKQKNDPEPESETESDPDPEPEGDEDDSDEDAPKPGETKAQTKSRRDRRIQQLVEQKNKAKTEVEELRAENARLKALAEGKQEPEAEPEADITEDPMYQRLIDKGYDEEAAKDMAEMLALQRESLRKEFAPAVEQTVAAEQQQRINTLAAEMKADGYELDDAWDEAIGETIKSNEAIQAILPTHPMDALRMAYKLTTPPRGAKATAAPAAQESGDETTAPAPVPPGRRPAGADDDLAAGLDFSGDIRSQLAACEAVVDRRQGKL